MGPGVNNTLNHRDLFEKFVTNPLCLETQKNSVVHKKLTISSIELNLILCAYIYYNIPFDYPFVFFSSSLKQTQL